MSLVLPNPGDAPIRIIPEAPYDNFAGGVITHDRRDNRRVIYFTGGHIDRDGTVVMLYSRYLYQVDLWKREGIWIPLGMEVDHIDDDPMNDELSNLQLLTKEENYEKYQVKRGTTMTVTRCAVCGKVNLRQRTQVLHHRAMRGGGPLTCSLECRSELLRCEMDPQIADWLFEHQSMWDTVVYDFEWKPFYGPWYPRCDDIGISYFRTEESDPMSGYKGLLDLRHRLPEKLRYLHLKTKAEAEADVLALMRPLIAEGKTQQEICAIVGRDPKYVREIMREHFPERMRIFYVLKRNK